MVSDRVNTRMANNATSDKQLKLNFRNSPISRVNISLPQPGVIGGGTLTLNLNPFSFFLFYLKTSPIGKCETVRLQDSDVLYDTIQHYTSTGAIFREREYFIFSVPGSGGL